MTAARAGVLTPGPLSRTFSRVPLDLIASAHSCGMPHKWAVLMYLCRFLSEQKDGTMFVSFPRAKMCSDLGLSDNQARGAVRELRRSGMLDVAAPGHKGRSTVYRLCVGSRPEPTLIAEGARQEPRPTTEGSRPGPYPTESAETCENIGAGCNQPLQASRDTVRTHPQKNSKKSSYSGSSLAGEGPGPKRPEPRVLKAAKLGPDDSLLDLLGGKVGGRDG